MFNKMNLRDCHQATNNAHDVGELAKKLSIIIPTLQQNKAVLTQLLKTLIEDTAVCEIIVIDNSLKGIDIEHEKLKVITPTENIYVNPAWNLGVKSATYDYIGILNDDIIIPSNFCSVMLNNIGSGYLSVNKEIIIESMHELSPISPHKISKKRLKIREDDWGIAFFFRKEIYTPIPEELKIWSGDDYLFYESRENGIPNYAISGFNICHIHSSTSSLPIFKETKYNDFDIWRIKYKPKFLYKEIFTKNIFTLRNEIHLEYEYKYLIVLGIRIPIKKKKIDLQYLKTKREKKWQKKASIHK